LCTKKAGLLLALLFALTIEYGIYGNARERPALCLPVGRGGDQCSDFKNPIDRAFLSGNRIFAETIYDPAFYFEHRLWDL
jgi:hypothetical protein